MMTVPIITEPKNNGSAIPMYLNVVARRIIDTPTKAPFNLKYADNAKNPNRNMKKNKSALPANTVINQYSKSNGRCIIVFPSTNLQFQIRMLRRIVQIRILPYTRMGY